MTTGDMQPFDHVVLAAVRHLTSGGIRGTSQGDAARFIISQIGEDTDNVVEKFPLAVERLRQDGLLMSNPSGQLRLTSAGQRHLE
jgi:hypothetical protein